MARRTTGRAKKAPAASINAFDPSNELAQLIDQFDWSATPIGPRASWPRSLKTAVGIMLTSRQPIWIGWGEELIYLYNDAYKSIIGGKHPQALGQPTSVVWREIWSDIAPMLSQAMGGQQGTYVESQLLIMERNGYPEETYYTFSYSPIFDDDGGVGGIFCANSDDTGRAIGERQLALLLDLAAASGEARTWQQACERSARALKANARDLPFAAIYVFGPDGEEAMLAGLTGFEDAHPALADKIRLDDGDPWRLGEVMSSHAPRIVDLAEVSSAPFPAGAWQRPPDRAMVLPIGSLGEAGRAGFLIAGVNPFRLADERYQSFMTLVAGQVTAAMVNAEAHEEERRRAEALAAIDRAKTAFFSDKARLYRAAQTEIERRTQVEADLRASEQRLEERVRERTAELSAAYERLVHETAEREKAEMSFQLMVRNVTDYAVFMLDSSGHVANWNAGAERIKGYTEAEIVGRHFQAFYTEEDRAAGVPARALDTAAREGKFEAEGFRVRKDGTQFWASVVINPVFDSDRRLVGFTKITRDITERRETQQALARAQEQLVQAQKMEGIGQLTGGVAHDFNNLLTVILGNLETLQRRLATGSQDDPQRMSHFLSMAMRGAERAASLTQRLLAFSRRQPLDPKPVDLGRLLSGMSDLLRRTLGEHIAVQTVLTGGLWRALVDPNQLEVAILNLAVNARDAMPDGGKLTLETANVYLDEAYAASQAEVVPGQYIVIGVTDSGTGMSREVMARAFEPFFTTKDIGHGTGLGLSQVYGFIKQSGGNVKIYSEPGQGTTVKIYLPRLHSDAATAEESTASLPPPKSTTGQTILVVEDEADVRAHSTGILQELGYHVLEASTGSSGLALLEKHPEVQLLFTDVGLPGGMNGRQLAEAARKLRPDLKVLFTTGYARNAIVHDGRLDPGVMMVPKPFTYAAVAAKVSEMLERAPASNRVLLVEDEVLIQMLASDYLEQLGYRVEIAGNAAEALSRAKLLNGELAFAVIDLGLPDVSGDVLARELKTLYPPLPIVIASGARVDVGAMFGNASDIAAIEKPYRLEDFSKVAVAVGARRG